MDMDMDHYHRHHAMFLPSWRMNSLIIIRLLLADHIVALYDQLLSS